MENGKLLIFSAPSGAGKTTIVKHLLSVKPILEFSISATSRAKRPNETDGVDYYFISAEEFRKKIDNNEFLEWEEVYTDQYYGTLLSELDRVWAKGHHVVFDVDVVGGLNIKKAFPQKALSIFVMPPTPEILKERLTNRSTEDMESLKKRLDKANWELTFANEFDVILVNDDLEETFENAIKMVDSFINK